MGTEKRRGLASLLPEAGLPSKASNVFKGVRLAPQHTSAATEALIPTLSRMYVTRLLSAVPDAAQQSKVLQAACCAGLADGFRVVRLVWSDLSCLVCSFFEMFIENGFPRVGFNVIIF